MARKVIDTFWDRKTRNDINDNFKELYDDNKKTNDTIDTLVLESGKSDLEVVQARGGKRVLNDRLNNIERTKRDKNQEIQMSELSQEVKEAMTGGSVAVVGKDSVGRVNIKNEEVSIEKLDFATGKSKNLFDGLYVDGVIFSNSVDGIKLVPVYNYGNTTGKVAIIKIDYNKDYYIKIHDEELSNRFSVGLSYSYPQFSEKDSDLNTSDPVPSSYQPLDKTLVRNNGLYEYSFSNEDYNYVIIYVDNEGNEPKMQVEEGDSPTNYISGRLIPDEYIDKNISFDDLSFTIGGTENIFDGNYDDIVLWNKSGTGAGTGITSLNNYDDFRGKTAVIEVERNTDYVIEVLEPSKSNRFTVSLNSTKPTVRDKGDLQTGQDIPAEYEIHDMRLHVNVGENIHYLKFNSGDYRWLSVYVSNEGEEPALWISTADYYPGGKKVIDPKYLPFNEEMDIEYPDEVAKNRFVDEMNRYANRIGMVDTNYVEPAGYPSTEEQTMTAYDMLLLGIQAASYNDLLKIWNKKSYVVEISGPDSRNVTINTTVTNEDLESDYYIFGGKTGRISDPAYASQNLVLIANAPNDRMFVGAIMGASTTTGRFTAMKEMFDHSKDILDGQLQGDKDITADCGASCLLPIGNAAFYEKYDILTIFKKADKTKRHPASVSKVKTAIIALDFMDNLKEKITVKESDIQGGTGNFLKNGDIITVEDALYAMMLPSSNTAAHAVARYVGNKLLNIDNE